MKQLLGILLIGILISCNSKQETIIEEKFPIIKESIGLVQELEKDWFGANADYDYVISIKQIQEIISQDSQWSELYSIFSFFPDSVIAIKRQEIANAIIVYSFLVDSDKYGETYIFYDSTNYYSNIGIQDDLFIQKLEDNWYLVVASD